VVERAVLDGRHWTSVGERQRLRGCDDGEHVQKQRDGGDRSQDCWTVTGHG